ncbi:MAG: aminotransferase class V-fold PLP-dependent enzyme [Rhodothermales bacterium]|nr:aminotransferase class V-fold PLP-dependent enzyme [Rhodothermales bacterium]
MRLLREEIREVENEARILDPGPARREQLRKAVVDYAERFLDTIEDRRAYIGEKPSTSPFEFSGLNIDPVPVEELLDQMDRGLDNRGINPASGGHLGYIPGGGVYPSALGDYLADVTNRYAGVFFANPGAVEMENMMIRWLAAAVGFPENAVGHLASGGSIANMTAIVTARDAAGLKGADYKSSCVYLTAQVHHCVQKAIRIAGLSEAPVREIPMDGRYRMDAEALERQITADTAAGLRPWLIVASAGTTDTGSVDPLDTIADIAERSGAWFHVDGAYGGLFNLVDEMQPMFKGMERADSVVVDPHKTLFLPYGTGAVLLRDQSAVFNSHRYTATYLQDALVDTLSPADISPELTKHFRGLRMWLPLRLFGTSAFVANLREKLLLARYFREEVRQIDGIEVGPEPDLSVVTFRFVPQDGDANTVNKQIIDAIHADGRVFLSSTMLDGVFTIRLAAVCFRTHLHTIDLAIEVIKDAIHKVVGTTRHESAAS